MNRPSPISRSSKLIRLLCHKWEQIPWNNYKYITACLFSLLKSKQLRIIIHSFDGVVHPVYKIYSDSNGTVPFWCQRCTSGWLAIHIFISISGTMKLEGMPLRLRIRDAGPFCSFTISGIPSWHRGKPAHGLRFSMVHTPWTIPEASLWLCDATRVAKLPCVVGDLCETNINECENSPCMNGATCVDLVNGYVCQCAAGFTDLRCR